MPYPKICIALLLMLVAAVPCAFAEPYKLNIPLGLTEPSIPENNPMTVEKIALGKKLYFDKRLSSDDTVACSNCHDPKQGFADALPTSKGIRDQLGPRNAPTVLNSSFYDLQFWDGRAPSLEEQAKGPIINPVEMGMPSHDALVGKLKGIPEYVKEFQGVFDRTTNECVFFTKTSAGGAQKAEITRLPLKSEEAKEKMGAAVHEQLVQELELLEMAGNPFSEEEFLAGKVTPVFFASALTNFGVEPFFDAFIHLAPCPHERVATRPDGTEIEIDPVTTPFSGYVFKLQANMDRRHRDSMAFIRICSGKFERDLIVKNHRTGREIRLSRPHGMVAGERTTLDDAYPGDIIGVINPSLFAIGDTLSISGGFNYKPLPQFQPELFARLHPKDVGKRKSFDKGVMQLTDEGAIQLLKSYEREGDYIFAAVGQL